MNNQTLNTKHLNIKQSDSSTVDEFEKAVKVVDGVVILERMFPDETENDLAQIYFAKIDASKFIQAQLAIASLKVVEYAHHPAPRGIANATNVGFIR
jgi:hypothetical protein